MTARTLSHLLAVARGDRPADILIKNARVVNVFTGEVYPADVAVAGAWIAGVGAGYAGRREVDLAGRYLVPGLIDAHVHLESSMVTPYEFARAVVPRGTTTVVADPHEIANVAGLEGIRYILEASEGLPLSVLVTLPSCVPATPLATSGARLEAADLEAFADHPRVLGLAEFMNVPGAVRGEPEALAKLLAFRDRHVDGHAPAVRGKWLQAYAAAGPRTDHESTTPEEVREKLRAGLYVFLREGTAARNLWDLLPALTPENARRVAFCTDDRHPEDLLEEGHIDRAVRLAVAGGVDPVTAIRMATLNAAEALGLKDRGAIAPGRRADLVATPSLEAFRAEWVMSGGRVVAVDGVPQGEAWRPPQVDASAVQGTVRVRVARQNLEIPARGRRVRVIGVVPGQIVTEHRIAEARIEDGLAVADPARDLLKLAVVERHGRGGGVGLGFVAGLGLKKGAIAGSVAHDAHNLIAAGADDRSMRTALRAVARFGGGYAAALGDEVLAVVPLPIAGLISNCSADRVRLQMRVLTAATRELGCALPDPFMPLSFLALEVIPQLKLTDQGLVDVERFQRVDLWVD